MPFDSSSASFGAHNDSHLKLHNDQSPREDESALGDANSKTTSTSRPTMPLFALDQLKQAGVPLKAQINPYLQMDPSIFRETSPQIIMPEGNESGRGKFEFAFGYIGWAVIGGFGIGSARGTFGEILNPQTKSLAWNPWSTRVLNASTKHGSGYAQTAGTAVFLYSLSELLLKYARADDVINSFMAGPIAGALYRGLPHGMRAGCVGAFAGFGLVTLWNLCDPASRRELKEIFRR